MAGSRRSSFDELKTVFEKLHSEEGCAWDKAQTQESLLTDLREEVAEYCAAVKAGDQENMQEELGDILLHVMFSAQIAQKNRQFSIDDVIEGLIKKLKRRHPHVFAKAKVSSVNHIIENWEKIKAKEKKHKRQSLR